MIAYKGFNMANLQKKIKEIQDKEEMYVEDYIERALSSSDPLESMKVFLRGYGKHTAKLKIKLETINSVVSEQYWN